MVSASLRASPEVEHDPWLLRTLQTFRLLGYCGKGLRDARWQALELNRQPSAVHLEKLERASGPQLLELL